MPRRQKTDAVYRTKDRIAGGRSNGRNLTDVCAVELAKQIRHGSVSVKEAVEACKKQIQKSESQVHAYVSMDEKILAHRIKEVEEGIKSGRYTGPLAGVPIAVKDNICTRRT